MSEIKTGVYEIKNVVTGKRYVGSTTRNFKTRWSDHKTLLNRNKHDNSRLQNSWNKYGEEAFEFKVLEYVPVEFCIQRENWWIELFGVVDDEYGYNIAPKAGNTLGYKHTEESRAIMREKCKGRTFSDETRQKLKDNSP